MTNAATVLDQICQFFGGAYDTNTHTYHTPTVSGISVVRRAWAKQDDFQGEYLLNQPVGSSTGCVIVVQVPDSRDNRVALPAVTGRRMSRFSIEMHGFLFSTAPYVEDAQDFGYALRDAIVAKIRTDPTLGTGGFENNAFEVGEGNFGEIATHLEQAVTEDEATKGYLLISFEAHSIDVA